MSKNKIPRKIRKRRSLFRSSGNQCIHCGISLSHETATLDHIIPASQGGSNALDNLVLSCFSCNNARGDKPIVEFSPHLRYLFEHIQCKSGARAAGLKK